MLQQNWPPLFPSRVIYEHRMLSQSLVWRLRLCKGQDNVSEAILRSIPPPLAFFPHHLLLCSDPMVDSLGSTKEGVLRRDHHLPPFTTWLVRELF